METKENKIAAFIAQENIFNSKEASITSELEKKIEALRQKASEEIKVAAGNLESNRKEAYNIVKDMGWSEMFGMDSVSYSEIRKIQEDGDKAKAKEIAEYIRANRASVKKSLKMYVRIAIAHFGKEKVEILKLAMDMLGYEKNTIATNFSQMKVDGELNRMFEVSAGVMDAHKCA